MGLLVRNLIFLDNRILLELRPVMRRNIISRQCAKRPPQPPTRPQKKPILKRHPAKAKRAGRLYRDANVDCYCRWAPFISRRPNPTAPFAPLHLVKNGRSEFHSSGAKCNICPELRANTQRPRLLFKYIHRDAA